jgi:2-oxoisovalerate dehydrogenase E1 component alpha subunit
VASWHAVKRGTDYCRRKRRPFMIEARVSRLYGHSSSSGALRVKNEDDPIALFEQKLLEAGVLDLTAVEQTHEDAHAEVEAALEQVLGEPQPTAADVETHTYAPSEVDAVYPGDYTGLPS